jgi:predicted CopG family antitoxin
VRGFYICLILPLFYHDKTLYWMVRNLYNELLKLGAEKQLVSDWLAVRKKKKLTNTQTALKGFLKQVDKSGNSLNDVLTKCIEKSWGGFEADWYKKEKRVEEKIRMF